MTKRPRRNHSATFKAKVSLEAIKEEQTPIELSERFQVTPKPNHAVEETTSRARKVARGQSLTIDTIYL